MSSFAELQALAAERSRIDEERKMAERLKRQREEKEKKAAAEALERERAKRQREALVDQERKKKEQAEAKRRELELKEERMKQLEQQRREALLKKNKTGTDMREFVRASDKAIRRANGGRRSQSDQNRKRDTIQEDEDGFLHGTSGSTLTREEKRQKRQLAMLGLGPSTSKKKISRAQPKNAQKLGNGEFIPLGTVKRDRRTIDEIDRELEAKRGKVASISEHVKEALPASAHLLPERQKIKILEQQRRNAMGLSPADYLPGAPVRADLVAKAKSREDKVQAKRESTKKKEKIEAPLAPTVKRKETARDRFLREEEERRRERQKHSSQKYEEDDEESEEEDEDEDEYESEGMDDEPDPSDIRNQIWQIFGKKRSAYVGKGLEDSDDDMEADMQSVAREEARSTRLARLEDEREERKLRKREQEKAARKAARSRRIE